MLHGSPTPEISDIAILARNAKVKGQWVQGMLGRKYLANHGARKANGWPTLREIFGSFPVPPERPKIANFSGIGFKYIVEQKGGALAAHPDKRHRFIQVYRLSPCLTLARAAALNHALHNRDPRQLIGRRLLEVIHHQNIDRFLGPYKPGPNLLLKRYKLC